MKKPNRNLSLWEEFGQYVLMSTSYKDILIEQAKGSTLIDVDGNEYIDLSSGQISALIGHSNPEFLKQLTAQFSQVIHTGTHFLSEPVLKASKKMSDIAPKGLSKVMFLSTGAEANEAAFRIAKTYTGKEGVVALTRGYAGLTLATLSATNFGKGAHPLVPNSGFVLTPECYRCPVEKEYPSCDVFCLDVSINFVKGLENNAAAIIVEPILSAGGMVFPPIAFMKKLKALAESWNALFIVDEAQTGFGRTGKWFGIEHYDITPDILVVSKGMGGGFPCSGVITTTKIADKIQKGYRNFSSHQSDPAAATSFLAVIDVIEQNGLLKQSEELGNYFLQRLNDLSRKRSSLKRPRGRGLMIGFDIEDPPGYGKKRFNAGQVLEALCLSKGLNIESTGKGKIFRVLPPLSISLAEIDRSITILDESLLQIESGNVDQKICMPKNRFSRKIIEEGFRNKRLLHRAIQKGLHTPPADLAKQIKSEWLKSSKKKR